MKDNFNVKNNHKLNLLKELYGEDVINTLLVNLFQYGIEAIKSQSNIDNVERREVKKKVVDDIWRYNDAEVDFVNAVAMVNGNVTKLGPVPIRILKVLLEHEGQALTRNQILESVWGSEIIIGDRTIDVHISALKKVLNLGEFIKSIRSVGYRIN